MSSTGIHHARRLGVTRTTQARAPFCLKTPGPGLASRTLYRAFPRERDVQINRHGQTRNRRPPAGSCHVCHSGTGASSRAGANEARARSASHDRAERGSATLRRMAIKTTERSRRWLHVLPDTLEDTGQPACASESRVSATSLASRRGWFKKRQGSRSCFIPTKRRLRLTLSGLLSPPAMGPRDASVVAQLRAGIAGAAWERIDRTSAALQRNWAFMTVAKRSLRGCKSRCRLLQ